MTQNFYESLRSAKGLVLSVYPGLLDGDLPKFDPELPLVVFFDAREVRAINEAVLFAQEQGAIAVSFGAPHQTSEHDEPSWRGDPELLIQIPASSAFVRKSVSSSDAVAVQLAVALAVEAIHDKLELPCSRSVLLRVSGSPERAESWAALYDRAWSLGLAPWNAVRIWPWVKSRKDEDEVQLDRLLFGDTAVLDTPLLRRTLRGSRAASALLASTEAAGELDLRRHGDCVFELLRAQLWTVQKPAVFSFKSAEASAQFTIDARPPSREAPKWDWQYILDHGLADVDTLAVTCTASPGAILSELSKTGALAVNIRDLMELPAGHSNIWSIVGAQLRRMVASLHSRPRTLFIGLLVDHALRSGRVEGIDNSLLHGIVRSEAFGKSLHFVIEKMTRANGVVSAKIRLEGGNGKLGVEITSESPVKYLLDITIHGPELTGC